MKDSIFEGKFDDNILRKKCLNLHKCKLQELFEASIVIYVSFYRKIHCLTSKFHVKFHEKSDIARIAKQAWVFEFFLLVCFRAYESHLVARSTSQRIRLKWTATTDARHSPLSSGPRGDKFKIMKVSDIFHLIQYLKTDIEMEKHNSVKKTVSIYITTCH